MGRWRTPSRENVFPEVLKTVPLASGCPEILRIMKVAKIVFSSIKIIGAGVACGLATWFLFTWLGSLIGLPPMGTVSWLTLILKGLVTLWMVAVGAILVGIREVISYARDTPD